jgi:hypothetical protein
MMRKLSLVFLTAITAISAICGLAACCDDSSNNNNATNNQHTHVLTIHNETAATCETDGNTLYYSCSGCNKWFSNENATQEITDHSSVVTAKLGHDWGEWQTITDASCTTAGLDGRSCSKDETHTQTRVITKLGHDYKDEITQPTCTEQGYTTYTCTRCDDSYVDDYVDAIGHNYQNDICLNCNSFLHFKYNLLSNNTYEIIGYNAELPTELIIPSTYNGKPVTKIADSAFSYTTCDSLSNVEKLTIPNTITSIGNYAFYGCVNLHSVYLSNSVTNIGNYAFNNDTSNSTGSYAIITFYFTGTKSEWNNINKGSSWEYNRSSIRCIDYIEELGINLELKEDNTYTITSIDNKELTEIIIPSTYKERKITEIGSSAFSEYENLISITIPDSVTSIGNYAFMSCSNLESVDIPDSVTSIDDWAFAGCISLKNVTIGSGVTSINNETFLGCSNLTNITVSESNETYKSTDGNIYSKDGKTLIQYALGKTDTTFSIPSTVTTITNSTFNSCSGLTTISIPDSVTSIGELAFANCSNLASITIPESVTEIAYRTFYNCVNLEKITLPNSLTSVADAFEGCNKLKYNKFDNANYLGNDSNKYLVLISPNDYSISSCTINSKTKVIADYAFCTLAQSDTARTVGGYTSYYVGCENLKTITIPDSVVSIGNYAFYYCGLSSITIGTGVTTIGDWASAGCNSLTSIVIPNNVKSIGEGAFYYCSNLGSVTLGSGITSISDMTFYECSSLISITIPNNVTFIGNAAFYDCYKLVDIYNLSNIDIKKGDYRNGEVAYYALNVYTPTSGESKLHTVNDYIFYEDGDTVYLMGYTGNAIELTIPENYNGKNYEIYNYAFYNFEDLQSVIIPDSVTKIGGCAFAECFSLTNVTLGKNVASIGNCAFLDCNSLTAIVLGNYVTSIDDCAFYGCTNLTSIVIGNSITAISEYTFYKCSNLKTLYYCGAVLDWAKISIEEGNDIIASTKIYYYSATQPTEAGNYWYYVNDEIVVWKDED